MTTLTSEVQAQQNSIGADSTALTETELRARTLNFLTVSGGYISTERDGNGNIMLHENPNILGSNKQLVNQYISIDITRRNYDNDELQKVFDTEINELLKPSKTKTADQLRAEIERMRRLLAQAEADIIIQKIVAAPETEIEVISSGEQQAPFNIEAEEMTFKVQTAIWSTENRRLEQLNTPTFIVTYKIYRVRATGKIYAEFVSPTDNPEQFQGWYFDAENLGNTQNYISTGLEADVQLLVGEQRNANQGDEKVYTIAASFKDESPPVQSENRITFQVQEFIGQLGARDAITTDFTWLLRDSIGNAIADSRGNVTNPFDLIVKPGQELTVSLVNFESSITIRSVYNWYAVTDHSNWSSPLTKTGLEGETTTFTIPEDMTGLIMAYVPVESADDGGKPPTNPRL